MPKKTIGRVDKADFPTLNLFDIDLKVDTGAYTSSMHCHNFFEEDGVLKCLFYDKGHPLYNEQHVIFENFSTTKVKSSNGSVQLRYKVKTSIIIFNKKYSIYLTLTDRDDMKYPILIGRRFLLNKFVVDVNKKYISFNQKNSVQKSTTSFNIVK